MSALSKQDVNASLNDLRTKKAFLELIEVVTVAAAGSSEADAGKLTGSLNVVTASDGAKGVILPKSKRDTQVEVVNTVSNQALKVYPDTGGQINALTATTGAFTQAAGSRAVYVCDADLHWYVAAANLTGVATAATQAQLDAATIAASNTRTITGTDSIVAADFGKVLYIDNATGFVTTLPAPAAGFKCHVILKTANTSGNHTIVTATSSNIIKGLQNSVAGDAGDFGTADDTISFVANSALPGDRVELNSDGTSWFAYATSKLAASITFTQAS